MQFQFTQDDYRYIVSEIKWDVFQTVQCHKDTNEITNSWVNTIGEIEDNILRNSDDTSEIKANQVFIDIRMFRRINFERYDRERYLNKYYSGEQQKGADLPYRINREIEQYIYPCPVQLMTTSHVTRVDKDGLKKDYRPQTWAYKFKANNFVEVQESFDKLFDEWKQIIAGADSIVLRRPPTFEMINFNSFQLSSRFALIDSEGNQYDIPTGLKPEGAAVPEKVFDGIAKGIKEAGKLKRKGDGIVPPK